MPNGTAIFKMGLDKSFVYLYCNILRNEWPYFKTSDSFSFFISPRLSSSPRYSFVLPREARTARDSRFISVSSEFSKELLSGFFSNYSVGFDIFIRFFKNLYSLNINSKKKDSAFFKMLKIIFNVIKHNP